MDPDSQLEQVLHGNFLVSYLPCLNEVTHILQNGEISSNFLISLTDSTVDACIQIHEVLQHCLIKSIET